MAGFWGARKKEREQIATRDAEFGRRADAALVAADERVRTTTDELAFAEIELGRDATRDLREALQAVRRHLGEAFQLNQLNHDHIPDTADEARARNERIIQLCDWAQDLLDDRLAALAGPVERARRAPEIIAGIRAQIERDEARIPTMEASVARLEARYSPDALRKIAKNPAEAAQLLAFARHSADVSTARRESGQREQANLALETAIEAGRRATSLLDAVDTFEVEALRAQTTLGAIVDDSEGDLVAARDLRGTPEVAAAMSRLEGELASLTPAGGKPDPFTELTRLREANAALDAVVATARERAARPVIPEAHVRHAIDDADRQLGVARSVIEGHRGWIGADARTRLAEADRIRSDLSARGLAAGTSRPIAEEEREGALADARRCGRLAAEALQLAQRDIDSSRPNDGGWGAGGGRRGGGGGDVVSGILGGLVIGSILDGIFD